jgi:hypothetical protein
LQKGFFCLIVFVLQVSSDADLRMEALKLISKSASVPELRAQLLSIGAIAPLVQMLSVQDRSLVRETQLNWFFLFHFVSAFGCVVFCLCGLGRFERVDCGCKCRWSRTTGPTLRCEH